MKKNYFFLAMLFSVFVIQAQNKIIEEEVYEKKKEVILHVDSDQEEVSTIQKESSFQVYDSPNNASLFHNIKLSDKLTFQNGVSVRKNFDFNTFEIPVVLKYDISNKWSTAFGIRTRSVINSTNPEIFNNSKKPSNSYLSIGTEYKFNNEAVGNISIGFPFDFQFGLKF